MKVSAADYARFRKAVVDIVAKAPNGVTLSDIQAALYNEYGLSRSKRSISAVVKEIRNACMSIEQDLFMVADNPGNGGEWRYRFTARMDDSIEWAAWRTGTIESQLDTMVAYYTAMVENAATPQDAWKAKIALKALSRALEDISAEAHP